MRDFLGNHVIPKINVYDKFYLFHPGLGGSGLFVHSFIDNECDSQHDVVTTVENLAYIVYCSTFKLLLNNTTIDKIMILNPIEDFRKAMEPGLRGEVAVAACVELMLQQNGATLIPSCGQNRLKEAVQATIVYSSEPSVENIQNVVADLQRNILPQVEDATKKSLKRIVEAMSGHGLQSAKEIEATFLSFFPNIYSLPMPELSIKQLLRWKIDSVQ